MTENFIEIDCSVNKTINYSMQQNRINAIHRIRLFNNSDVEYSNLDVRIGFSPEFAEATSVLVEHLMPAERMELSIPEIKMNGEYLAPLTEKEMGTIRIFVFQGEEKLATASFEIEILPYDYWNGSLYMPELLSTFVMPNHPVVTTMLPKCCKYLSSWGKSASITGYETQNPNDVKAMMAAAYEAIRTENICYSLPPVSYEQVGQKIRTPEKILEQRMGTCLDLSLLMASLLEAMCLNPILILAKEHAYVGCWLDSKTFPECITDDSSALLKRTAEGIDEIMVVECTSVTVDQNVDFENAIKIAKTNLAKEDNFQMAIDVKRCRGCNILPLPSRVLKGEKYEIEQVQRTEYTKSVLKNLSEEGHVEEITENVMTKKQLWERKLLDLSLRNSLLNFKVNKNTVQLMVPNLGILEDELNKKQEFSILSIPEEAKLSTNDSKIYEGEECNALIESTGVSEFEKKRIRTFLKDSDLESSLKYLQRQAKHSLEENGSNTLYLALGFMKWFETDKSQKPHYAPLILVPVDIVKKIQDHTYHLKLRDEESQVNVTLLEFLRQDFSLDIGGLDPLPLDENGVDVPKVLNIFRQSIMDKKHWDILPFTFLGIFSFSRFIMWNDIRNRSKDIESNKVVSSLLSGKMEWEPAVNVEELAQPDRRVSPKDMAVVMSADSSQLKAIETAAKGESFVLHGPPGTGKSQTITNMIANALYQGKSVLFVAEKMAALSVVEKRLDKVGLGAFCLELHSNKAQKSAVLKQLEETLESAKVKSTEEFEQVAERLAKTRAALNDTVEALHQETQCGLSVYELVGKYENNQKMDGKIDFTGEWAAAVTKDEYEDCVQTLLEYADMGASIGDLKNHPLADFRFKDYSVEIRRNWTDCLNEYSRLLDERKKAYDALASLCGLDSEVSLAELTWLESLIGCAVNAGCVSPVLACNGNAMVNSEYITGRIEALKEYVSVANKIKEQFKPDIFSYDIKAAKQRLISAQSKWVLAKKKEITALIKELRFMSVSPSVVINENNLSAIYDQIDLYYKAKEEASVNEFFQSAFSSFLKGENTDCEALEKHFKEQLSLAKLFRTKELESEKIGIMEQYALNGSFEQALSMNKEVLDGFMQTGYKCIDAESELIDTYGLSWNGFYGATDFISSMKESIEKYLSNSEEMRSYASFCMAEDKLVQYKLSELSELFRSGEIRISEILSVFECNFAKAAATYYISNNPVLAHFEGSGFNASIETFKSLSDRFENLTRQEVAARLSAQIPKVGTDIADSSELGILLRAIKSNGRNMPIRKLFNQIPTLLRRMCPCMLMSPISVAQYIDPSFPKFDLVIFDEASQLPTGEAVGTLARGTNAIVVGDPKQLPPTSFFMVNHQNDEDFLEVEDMESLLDDCLALSMPQQHLLWHYRSRHESLIAYSNAAYYDNKLYTFPSPNDLVSAVKFVPVEGYYDRGKTKQNKAEAEAIIAEIARRLKDEELRKSSIGVVTFSSVQQELIEDMLLDLYVKEPELESLAAELEEPIFIKNLENVQGDERDVILFSIGYGPDEKGYVGMNFGPLNQDGGWRRLNVAISRSRKEMMIFSVLQPHQIDMSRTSSEGVYGLKGFLEYAKNGRSALYVNGQFKKPKNFDIAKSIAAKIEAAGYKTVIDIGSSEYKVELGVVDPENPDLYCLGILIDGESYMATDTARDRNILQPSVLTGLGWKLIHVWTLDWFDTPERETRRIIEAIKKAVNGENPEEEGVAEASETVISEELQAVGEPSVELNETMDSAEVENGSEESESLDSQSYIKNAAPYIKAELPVLGDSEDFYLENSVSQIKKAMGRVIEKEGPISADYLYKRVVTAWGMNKVTAKAEDLMEGILMSVACERTQAAGQTFLWPEGSNPQNYRVFRLNEGDEEGRSLADVAPEEILNLVTKVIHDNISLSTEDLIKVVSAQFGCKRRTATTDKMVGIAISYAEQRGIASISEDGLKVTEITK